MHKNCENCAFLMDIRELIPLGNVPDGVPTRCIKERRWNKDDWPLAIHDPTTESCQHFTPHTERHHRWEWDDAKSHRTKRERGISFDEATAALETDRHAVRIPVGNPSKWENLEGLDYEKEGIERTVPNTDPVRDMYIFKHHGKTWVLIATLRGELALVHKRVISVRRAKSKEERLYDNQALSGNAGM